MTKAGWHARWANEALDQDCMLLIDGRRGGSLFNELGCFLRVGHVGHVAGGANPLLLETLHSLGMTLQSEGRLQESEKTFAEARDLWIKQGDVDMPQTVAARKSLLDVLIKENKFDAAANELDQILTPKYIQESSDCDLLNLRLDLMARRGLWARALSDACLVIQKQPDEHYNYHKLAALLVMNKDYAGYRKLCQTIFSKFSETGDAYIAERMAQDCLLLPDSGVPLVKLDEMADYAVRPEHDGISLCLRVCPWAQVYYSQKRAEGKSHACALRCLGQRLLKILWRMIQTRTPDDAELHAKNQLAHGSWVLQLMRQKPA